MSKALKQIYKLRTLKEGKTINMATYEEYDVSEYRKCDKDEQGRWVKI